MSWKIIDAVLLNPHDEQLQEGHEAVEALRRAGSLSTPAIIYPTTSWPHTSRTKSERPTWGWLFHGSSRHRRQAVHVPEEESGALIVKDNAFFPRLFGAPSRSCPLQAPWMASASLSCGLRGGHELWRGFHADQRFHTGRLSRCFHQRGSALSPTCLVPYV